MFRLNGHPMVNMVNMVIHENSVSELVIPLDSAQRDEWNGMYKNVLKKSPGKDFLAKNTYLEHSAPLAKVEKSTFSTFSEL